LVLECLSKEALSGPAVSAPRDQKIDDIAVLVDRPPQVVAFAPDRNEQFIDVTDDFRREAVAPVVGFHEAIVANHADHGST
jgi:hypothetical protein